MVERPWELEEKILSLIPTKSLARFRFVCKRWNALFNDKRFANNHLSRARPQFILFVESKICLVDVNLDGPSIEVHNLPQFVPGYRPFLVWNYECCDGLLMFTTTSGTGICNPWLRQIRWNESIVNYPSGIGYDNSRPDKQYKIFSSWRPTSNTTLRSNIIDFGSDARESKTYEFAKELYNTSSVSLNGTLYWIVYSRVACDEHCIQTFDFSTERFEFYCNLPTKTFSREDPRSLAVYRGDRFSFLEKERGSRNIEIWVTKEKIKSEDGEVVEWMKFMNVTIPEWSSYQVWSTHPPSYFIDDKSPSLVMCFYNKERKATIYIATSDNKFNEIKINDLVEDYPHHLTYFPSLVQVPTFTMSGREPVDSCFTFPRGVQASNGAGGNEWDDGFFDRVEKIYIRESDLGCVFVKFDYIKDNTTVAGAGHWNATTLIPELENNRIVGRGPNQVMIADDDYIEAIEGTYTESRITSITFRMHKERLWPIQRGLFNGKPFVLQGGKGSKIIGFYGRSSGDHLTALGVHFSSPS